MLRLTRRRFVQGSLALGAAAFLPTARAYGANEDLRIGFIGLGVRGSGSVEWFSKVPGVRIAALAEPDLGRLDKVAQKYPDASKSTDLRHMLDDKNIDAVVISAPNYWHALAGIWACQAGKDVYVEKPVSQTIWEGRKLVEAARKYNRIVQGGTQQRSDDAQQQIREFLHGGKIGKIQYVRSNVFGMREPIGKRETPLTPPGDVDYNLWLGPAADEPMYREQFHYDWHWVWNTGSGEMGNWGVHILDDVRNTVFNDKCTMPVRCVTAGGRTVWNDAGETPNAQFVYYDTGSVPVFFSVTNLPEKPGERRSPAYKGIRYGYVVHCEGGYYAGGRGGGSFYDNDGKRITKIDGDGGGKHAQNFIDAVRSRKSADLNAEIEETHHSTNWCHLANIGFRAGKQYDPQDVRSRVKDNEVWTDVVGKFEEHMAAHNIDLSSSELQMSPVLEIDPKKETLVGKSADKKTKALLRRSYRKGFEVPEKV